MKKSTIKVFLFIVLINMLSIRAHCITAEFSYSKRSNCAPAIVDFVNKSTSGSGITYSWNFGLGSIVTAADNSPKQQIYITPGVYEVTLIATDGIDADTTSQVVTILKGPSASFTADATAGCSPFTVTFSSTSTPGDADIDLTWWDFRTGESKTGTSVQYVYENPGTYDVIMKVTDNNGCSSIKESDNFITVANSPVAAFTATEVFACSPPLNVTFINLSTGSTGLTYLWDYGNGITSTEISNSTVYNTIGNYTVKLSVTDQYGCSASLIKDSYINVGNTEGSLYVYNSENILIEDTVLCGGTYTFVTSASGLPYYQWTINDNNSVTTLSGTSSINYMVSDTGTLVIQLEYGDDMNCTNNISKAFAKTGVTADFTLNTDLFCSLPQAIDFTNNSENASTYLWYSSGVPFSSATDTSYTITKNDIPALSYQQLYSHEINSIPVFFKLVAANLNGCIDSVVKDVTISLPVARFVPDKISGCIPLSINLYDSSKSAFMMDRYVYKIAGDSIISDDGDPVSYTITEAGEYEITEIIYSGNCYDTSYVVKVVAGDKVTPDFTVFPSVVCNGEELTVSGSSDNNAAIDAWHFISPDIFDLTFNSVPDTTIQVYSNTPGLKNLRLDVDYNGCFSEITKNDIFEITGPSGDFTQSFSCDSPLVYLFKTEISPATSLTWHIDTAVYNNVDSVLYKFPSSGDYTVNLTVTDALSGCSLSRTKTIKVRQVYADFTFNDTIFCAGQSISLDASSSIDYINNCYNEGFLWDFGDGTPPRRTYLTSYHHNYMYKDTCELILAVSADNGCIDTARQDVYIFRPEGSFTADVTSGCVEDLDVNFDNTSTDGSIISWIWNFGDNTSDNTNSDKISHTYTSSTQATFYAFLTVYDAYNCFSSTLIPINLIDVNADFQADDNAICEGQTVTFTPVDTALESMSWNFGENASWFSENTYTYSNYGVYSVSLTASKNGCTNTLTKNTYVNVEKASAGFSMSDTVLSCYPDTIQFVRNPVGSNIVDQEWTFGSTPYFSSSDSVSYVFFRTGNYPVQMTVRTLNGCMASASNTITVNGPTAVCNYNPNDICYNDEVTFFADSLTNVGEWEWLFGDGSTSTENPATHTYTSRGTIFPAILLIDGECAVTDTLDTLYVSLVEAGFTGVGDSLPVCNGTHFNLTNTSSGSNQWIWEINGNLYTRSYDFNTVILPVIGANTITLRAFDEGNCSDVISKVYTVIASPEFTIDGNSTVCANEGSVRLSVTPEDKWTIDWWPTTSIDNPTSFTVNASPDYPTTYTATVTDSMGCSTSVSKTLTINEIPGLRRIPAGDTIIDIGSEIQLMILTTGGNDLTYSWSPNYKITCTNCSNPYVSPYQTTTYSVRITDECIDITEDFLVEVIKNFYLEAPTAFTPNGDFNNDEFKFEADNIKNFEVRIFDRWGKIVFTTNNIDEGWDGKVNGKLQNTDTYVYYVSAETNSGYKFEKKGSLLLLK